MPSDLVPSGSDSPSDLAALITRLGEVFRVGQQQIEAVKVSTYWEAGRLIHGHILQRERRAEYGKQVMPKLAESLALGEHMLYRMVRFYEAFPILTARSELTWTHYRLLAQVADGKERHELETRAAGNHWSARELEDKIKEIGDRAAGSSSDDGNTARVRLLEPKRGKIGLYRIVADGKGCAVDLGFTSYWKVGAPENRRRKPDELVTLSEAGRAIVAPEAAVSELYTYQAAGLRVVDGDTFWAQIWLSKQIWLREKLRLRGLDAPELDTAEGRTAKRAVELQFKKAQALVITTTKPDKWDRYLADVFLRQLNGEELYLNNFLLAEGYARRMEKVAPSDWEDA